MKHLSKLDFAEKWQAHFGRQLNPIVQSILQATNHIHEKDYEDTQLCWELDYSGAFSFAIAFELTQDGEWHLLLPRRLFDNQATVTHAWIGREMACVSYYARELTERSPFCLIEVKFTSHGIEVEVFFGNPK